MANAKRTRATLKASDKALEPSAPMHLTQEQRKEINLAREQANKADTEAALARPIALTPLQQKRLEFSEAKKAALKARKKH